MRHSAAATGLNGLLYVMGGHSGNGPVVWAEVYNPATRAWRILPDMPTGGGSPGGRGHQWEGLRRWRAGRHYPDHEPGFCPGADTAFAKAGVNT